MSMQHPIPSIAANEKDVKAAFIKNLFSPCLIRNRIVYK